MIQQVFKFLLVLLMQNIGIRPLGLKFDLIKKNNT